MCFENGAKCCSKTMQLAADEDRALKDLQLLEIVFSLATSGHKQHVPQVGHTHCKLDINTFNLYIYVIYKYLAKINI